MSNALALLGDGYTLSITADATLAKAVLLSESASVKAVTTPTDYDTAQATLSALAAMRIAVDKSREAVKAPVLDLGRRIDSTARDFVAEIAAEESRIRGILGAYATEQARIRAEQEAKAKAAAQEAERLKREAEAEARRAEEQAARAESLKTEAARTRANNAAEEARNRAVEANRAAQDKQTEVLEAMLAPTPATPAGVREELDYEVTDIAALYKAAPHLVELTPRRKEILAVLKRIPAESDVTIPGITVRKVMKIR